MTEITIDDIGKLAKDSFYVTVGLGLIAFQRAQVQRQAFRKQIRDIAQRAV